MAKMFKENTGERMLFPVGAQKLFLEKIQNKLGLNLKDFSKIAGVCVRSMTDWKREKNLASLSGIKALCKKAHTKLPKDIKIKDRFWYTNKGSVAGGLATYKKYGSLNKINEEYRKKKWLEWWNREGRFKKNSIVTCLPFNAPPDSASLAEIFGIILGDGGITKYQLTVTLNKSDDKDFIRHVSKLFQKQFNIKPSLCGHKKANVTNIVISRKKLIEFLLKKGLKIGNKVKHQISVPKWIHRSEIFTKYCLRGLLDTDGCFFVDKHKYKNKIYLNCGINFTNRSLPILNFFKQNLIKFGYRPTQKTEFSIFLRQEKDVVRYFKEIGTSNSKHLNKFKKYFANKLGGVG